MTTSGGFFTVHSIRSSLKQHGHLVVLNAAMDIMWHIQAHCMKYIRSTLQYLH